MDTIEAFHAISFFVLYVCKFMRVSNLLPTILFLNESLFVIVWFCMLTVVHKKKDSYFAFFSWGELRYSFLRKAIVDITGMSSNKEEGIN